MSQQISIEDAFPTFQRRCRELFEENLVLHARVDTLERRLAETQAVSEPAPSGGPDLAAQPPYPDEERG
ncbi:hypothetical protein OG342_04810 [Streptomyces bobili]|uniref:hypothetical protein n=1 Tax=Streptomyces bobili TaxID=67280 RepID=UPI00225BE15E|nr:hypothetical protein [Streptomyces bobili]MCX5522189.1 hypothetical protein [Streptomyces bobili]